MKHGTSCITIAQGKRIDCKTPLYLNPPLVNSRIHRRDVLSTQYYPLYYPLYTIHSSHTIRRDILSTLYYPLLSGREGAARAAPTRPLRRTNIIIVIIIIIIIVIIIVMLVFVILMLTILLLLLLLLLLLIIIIIILRIITTIIIITRALPAASPRRPRGPRS